MESTTEPSLEGGLGIYRPVGSVSFDELTTMIRDAVAFCAARHIRELLVDTTRTTGFNSPSTLQRFTAVESWAGVGMGRVRLAVIARAEHIDPRRFGVTVAHNRGLSSNIFSTEAQARAWLDAMRAGTSEIAPDTREAH